MLEESAVSAADLMTRDVVVVRPDTPLADAVRLMAEHRIGGLPVVDGEGNLVGMISEGDLLRWREGLSDRQALWLGRLADGLPLSASFINELQAEHYKVKTAMSAGVTTVTEGVAAREIADIMFNRSIKRVPVLRDGKIVGIVSRSDLVRALAQKLNEQLPPPEPPLETLDEALRRGREESKRQPPGAGSLHIPPAPKARTPREESTGLFWPLDRKR